jgi:hypothetical protein
LFSFPFVSAFVCLCRWLLGKVNATVNSSSSPAVQETPIDFGGRFLDSVCRTVIHPNNGHANLEHFAKIVTGARKKPACQNPNALQTRVFAAAA